MLWNWFLREISRWRTHLAQRLALGTGFSTFLFFGHNCKTLWHGIGVGVWGSTWSRRRPSVPLSCTGSKLTSILLLSLIFFSRSRFTVEVGGAEVTSCIIHRAQSRHIAKKIIFSHFPMIGKPSNLSGSVRSSDSIQPAGQRYLSLWGQTWCALGSSLPSLSPNSNTELALVLAATLSIDKIVCTNWCHDSLNPLSQY